MRGNVESVVGKSAKREQRVEGVKVDDSASCREGLVGERIVLSAAVTLYIAT